MFVNYSWLNIPTPRSRRWGISSSVLQFGSFRVNKVSTSVCQHVFFKGGGCRGSHDQHSWIGCRLFVGNSHLCAPQSHGLGVMLTSSTGQTLNFLSRQCRFRSMNSSTRYEVMLEKGTRAVYHCILQLALHLSQEKNEPHFTASKCTTSTVKKG